MPSFFITGASRGIGLAIVTELLKDPQNRIIATARAPSSAAGLQELRLGAAKDRLTILTLDISNPTQISKAAEEAQRLLPDGLDYLINNAGISHQSLTTFEDLDIDLFSKELLFNTVPILHLLRAFKPLIAKSSAKKVITITSDLGSLESAGGRPNLANAYSVGKAALNMLIRKWGTVHKGEGITAVLIHPGWVETELGLGIESWIQEKVPGLKPLTVQQSAAGVVRVSLDAKLEDSVSFFNYDGTKLSW